VRKDELERGWRIFQELRDESGKPPSLYRPIMRDVVLTDVDERAFGYLQGEYLRYAEHGVPMVLRDVQGNPGGAFLVGNDWVIDELRGFVEAGTTTSSCGVGGAASRVM
jgi:hypothetical protein